MNNIPKKEFNMYCTKVMMYVVTDDESDYMLIREEGIDPYYNPYDDLNHMVPVVEKLISEIPSLDFRLQNLPQINEIKRQNIENRDRLFSTLPDALSIKDAFREFIWDTRNDLLYSW